MMKPNMTLQTMNMLWHIVINLKLFEIKLQCMTEKYLFSSSAEDKSALAFMS